MKYQRVLLKLSGEALKGQKEYGICGDVLSQLAEELAEVHKLGVQLSVVVGGGNIHRGYLYISFSFLSSSQASAWACA